MFLDFQSCWYSDKLNFFFFFSNKCINTELKSTTESDIDKCYITSCNKTKNTFKRILYSPCNQEYSNRNDVENNQICTIYQMNHSTKFNKSMCDFSHTQKLTVNQNR